MPLSDAQMNLLSQLAYLTPPEGQAFRDVGEMADWFSRNPGAIPREAAGMSEEAWKESLQLIARDEQLSSLQPLAADPSHADFDGDGRADAFAFKTGNGQAVVAFRGSEDMVTHRGDWKDNCDGGYLADTPQQIAAKRFVDHIASEHGISSVEVTGHSKGGNLAQYVAVTSPLVARCVSFDGQGFSKAFIDKYHSQVDAAREKITSICAENDYVNVLLTPIAGRVIYIRTEDIQELGFYSHRPDILIDKKTGRLREQTDQNPVVAAIHDTVQVILTVVPAPVGSWIVDVVLDTVRGAMNSGVTGALEALQKYDLLNKRGIGLAVAVCVLVGVVFVVAHKYEQFKSKLIELVQTVIAAAIAVDSAVQAVATSLLQAVDSFFEKLTAFASRLFGRASYYAGALVVNTDHLRGLAWRVHSIRNRAAEVEWRLARLAALIEPEKKLAVMSIMWSLGTTASVAQVASYLNSAADRLDGCEVRLTSAARQFST